MPKRFLNVEYSGNKTRIDVTDFEDLSEVQIAVNSFFGEDIPGPASRIQLYDQQDQLITDLDYIPKDYYKKLKDGGISLVIRTLPPPTRKSSMNELFAAGLTSFSSAAEDFYRKRQRIEISDL